MQKTIWLAATAMSLAANVALAQDPRVELGILTCNLAEARDAPASAAPSAEGQFRDILCSFKPSKGICSLRSPRVLGSSSGRSRDWSY